MDGSYTSAVGSRLLSASLVDSALRLLLFYENSNGYFSVLRKSYVGRAQLPPTGFPSVAPSNSGWVDLTDKFRDELIDTHWNASFSTLEGRDEITIIMSDKFQAADRLKMWSCDALPKCMSRGTVVNAGYSRELDLKLARFHSEGEISGVWINSSHQLLTMGFSTLFGFGLDVVEKPEPPFPFSRIAAISSNTSKEYSVALYRQINEDVLAEALWQPANGIWVSRNITIPIF